MEERARTRPGQDGEYSVRQVAELLGLPVARVRSLARTAGLDGASFGFQDVVVLRSLAGLASARVSPRRMRGAIERLARAGESLAGVRLSAEGKHVLVRDDDGLWDASTGQGMLDFAPAARAGTLVALGSRSVAPVVVAAPADAPGSDGEPEPLDADGWFDLAQGAEQDDPAAALEAYQKVLERDPRHFPALINVGRLWHESGEPERAEAAYRAALAVEADHPLASFNLAVLLGDSARPAEAIVAYRATIAADPSFADAHFNLARLLEKAGDKLGAVRHLSRYRQLCK